METFSISLDRNHGHVPADIHSRDPEASRLQLLEPQSDRLNAQLPTTHAAAAQSVTHGDAGGRRPVAGGPTRGHSATRARTWGSLEAQEGMPFPRRPEGALPWLRATDMRPASE